MFGPSGAWYRPLVDRVFRLMPVLMVGLLAAPASLARTFGTDPIPIDVGPGGQAANGPSGGASISGDNRTARYVAFHSAAADLVAGDTNGTLDVFLYRRPSGSL